MRVRGAKIPLFSYLLSPLRVPEGPQRFGMGPRNQHDGYRLDGPTRRQSGPAIHPPGLRLERQAFLDSRGAAVPSGPLHHRGRGSGLGWERRQVGFRQAALPSCPLAAAKPSEQVKITWCSSSTCAKNLEAKGKESCSLKRPKRKNERRDQRRIISSGASTTTSGASGSDWWTTPPSNTAFGSGACACPAELCALACAFVGMARLFARTATA